MAAARNHSNQPYCDDNTFQKSGGSSKRTFCLYAFKDGYTGAQRRSGDALADPTRKGGDHHDAKLYEMQVANEHSIENARA